VSKPRRLTDEQAREIAEFAVRMVIHRGWAFTMRADCEDECGAIERTVLRAAGKKIPDTLTKRSEWRFNEHDRGL
jgi:hypothetical protein